MSNGEAEAVKGTPPVDKTVIKTLAQCSFAQDGEMSAVDVKDGKILRIRPHHHKERYSREEIGPWSVNKDGNVYDTAAQRPACALPDRLQEAGLLAKPHQVPAQARGLGPKGASGTRRTGARASTCGSAGTRPPTIIADEIRRIHKEYGPCGVLAHGDGHGETKTVHGAHAVQMDLLELTRRLHAGHPQRRQLGGLVLGHQARVGQRARTASASRPTT